VAITPHVAAVTRPAQAVEFISSTIIQLDKGQHPTGQVDLQRGY
jgi:glyoxylate/hydroxypyruvate reductase A